MKLLLKILLLVFLSNEEPKKLDRESSHSEVSVHQFLNCFHTAICACMNSKGNRDE
jgi:hypothetical protein